jgi:hypothetical protein
MDKYKKLETITNGLNAANKIMTLQTSAINQRSKDSAYINPALLSQMLHVIAQYSPDKNKILLTRSLEQTDRYRKAIRELKEEVLNIREKNRINKDDVIRTLHIIKPIVDPNRQTILEKILKIQEILDS